MLRSVLWVESTRIRRALLHIRFFFTELATAIESVSKSQPFPTHLERHPLCDVADAHLFSWTDVAGCEEVDTIITAREEYSHVGRARMIEHRAQEIQSRATVTLRCTAEYSCSHGCQCLTSWYRKDGIDPAEIKGVSTLDTVDVNRPEVKLWASVPFATLNTTR